MISQIQNNGEQWSAGIAYIALPNDIDRDLYVKDCYLNCRVSIKLEDGSMINRVPIGSDILNFITFPIKSNELGTAVVFVTEPNHKQPIIIARVQKSDELGDGRENVFQFRRKFNDKLVSIVGDVKEGMLSFNVNAGDKQGSFKILVDNDEDDCNFDLEVSGQVNIKTTDITLFENHNQFKSIVSDNDEENQSEPSIISQTRTRSLIANKEVVINGSDISAVHYKGYRIAINESGIQIDSLDKEIVIQSGNNKVLLNSQGIIIESDKEVSINGGFEALYNTVPGTPIANVGQIGISKKVKIG